MPAQLPFTHQENELRSGSELDRLTRWAAVAISRRTILKGTMGAAVAATGIGWFSPLAAAADNCTQCNSPCSACGTCTGCCTSPNRQHTWCGNCCTCSACDWTCGCFYAYQNVCDSGSHNWGCSPWCWC